MDKDKDEDAPTLSRRLFLGSTASAAVFSAMGVPTATFGQSAGAADFLAASQRLTGMQNLDEDIATAMLQAFQRTGKSDAVSAMIDGEADPTLENEVVAAWYTGVSPDPKETDVLTYTDALMWEAMPYTKPMGFCGGGMGYWADPPAA